MDCVASEQNRLHAHDVRGRVEVCMRVSDGPGEAAHHG